MNFINLWLKIMIHKLIFHTKLNNFSYFLYKYFLEMNPQLIIRDYL